MTWTVVAEDDEIAVGKVAVFERGDGLRVALCRTESGIYAIEDVCTHDGGPLDQGELIGCAIECPRHGARFDVRTGAVLALPAVRPVRSFEVRQENGMIEADLPEEE